VELNMPNVKQKKKTTGRPLAKKSAAKSPLKHSSWDAVELETLNPLLQRQLLSGKNVMVARILLKKGCIVPLHSHHNEQISYVLEGALEFRIDRRKIVANVGDVLVIPPHMPHKVEALSDSVSLDIFSPPRADWLRKTDSYLREVKPQTGKSPQIVG
jgi:quercetin dioxygenase-like cupin family protein